MPPNAKLTVARPHHASSLVALDLACAHARTGMVIDPDEVRSSEKKQELLSKGKAIWWVFETGGEAVAEVSISRFSLRRMAHVGTLVIAVHPEHQRRGYGRRLLQHAVDEAKALGLRRVELCVRSDNHRAKELYRTEGFVLEGVRRQFLLMADGSFLDDELWALLLPAQ